MPSLYHPKIGGRSVQTLTRVLEVLTIESYPRYGWAILIRFGDHTDLDGRPGRPPCPPCAALDRAYMERYGHDVPDDQYQAWHCDHYDDLAHEVAVEVESPYSPIEIGDCTVCGAEAGECLRPFVDFEDFEILRIELDEVPQFDELLDPELPYDPSGEEGGLRPPIVFGPVELPTTRKDGETRAREIARAPRGSGADRLAAIGEMLDDE